MDRSTKLFMAAALWAAVLSISLSAAAQPCSRDSVRQAASDARALRAKLLAAKLTDGMDQSVPQPIRMQIRELKNTIEKAVSAYLRCEPAELVDLKAMESSLLTQMAVNEPEDDSPPYAPNQPVSAIYGSGLKVSASRPDGRPQLIAVTAAFGINCGTDTMLLIYERPSGTWQRTLRWRSDNYDQISDAFGDFFQFSVLSQDTHGKWLAAVAHGTPWCTSRWSRWSVDLIQPASSGEPQRTKQHIQSDYIRENAPVFKRRSDGFEFRVEKGSLDVDVMTRAAIYRYRLADDQLQRMQPIAMNGRDFVDEWLQVEWSDARHWSDPANLSILEKVHAGFRALRAPAAKNLPLFTYGAVRACSDDSKHFQVELKSDPGQTTYFRLNQGENSFSILSAGAEADQRCKGADLMRKR